MSERTEHDEAGRTDTVADRPRDAESVCNDTHVDCTAALHELYQYLDGEMTETRRAEIRLHIEECAPCLDAFDFEMELRQLVARTCQCEAPEALRDRIAQALRDCDQGSDGAGIG